MRWRTCALPCAWTALCLALPGTAAAAQGAPTGCLEGYVFDQTGVPILGVKLSVSPAGSDEAARVVYSDDEGGFRATALPAGRYGVRASAPKFKPLVQADLTVTAAAACTELNLVMETIDSPEPELLIHAPAADCTAIDRGPVADAPSTVPRVTEAAAGAEREVWQGIAMGLGVVARRFDDDWRARQDLASAPASLPPGPSWAPPCRARSRSTASCFAARVAQRCWGATP